MILRNRLRQDGYLAAVDTGNDARQAIRLVRASAGGQFDPQKVGMVGFSAGDPLRGIFSRLDVAGMIYPGPSPYARNRTAPEMPADVPPAFPATGGSGDRMHALWTLDCFGAILAQGVPNIELPVSGRGRHPGEAPGDPADADADYSMRAAGGNLRRAAAWSARAMAA